MHSTDTLTALQKIDALRAEYDALVAEADVLRCAPRTEPDLRRALALYGRASELAGECQLRLLARLTAVTTPSALGARSWVEFVSVQLGISHDDARRRLNEVAALGP